MVRPPIITWITFAAMVLASLMVLAACGLEAFAVEETTEMLPWGALAVGALAQILAGLFMPMAARWTTVLGWLVSMGVGAAGVLMGWMWATQGVFGLTWVLFGGLASLGAAFLAFVSFFFVHQYRSSLEEMF